MLKWIFNALYVSTFTLLVSGALIGGITHLLSWSQAFHLAYFAPSVAILAIISGQFDLLAKIRLDIIRENESVSVRARITDFIHWLMSVGIDVGTWMRGSVSISALILKLLLLSILGWQVGTLRGRLSSTSTYQTIQAVASAIVALGLGLAFGFLRFSDTTVFGYGWWVETSSAIIAILLVTKFIWDDLQFMRVKGTGGYTRSLFQKGVLGNLLIVWFWLHTISQGGFGNGTWWLQNASLTISTIVGNLIYIGYWLTYEYYRKREGSMILPQG